MDINSGRDLVTDKTLTAFSAEDKPEVLGLVFCLFLLLFVFLIQLQVNNEVTKSFAGVFFFKTSDLDKSFADEVKPCSAFKLRKHIFPTSGTCVFFLCLCAKKMEVLFSMGMFYN